MTDLTTAVRAGDADRDVVAERLRAAYAEGRLDDAELHERLGTALAARTVAELAPLTADLPQPSPARQAQRPSRRQHRPAAPARVARLDPMRAAWAAWVLAVSVNLVIWVLVSLGTSELVYFWPGWVAGPWGAVLLSRTLLGRSGRPWCTAPAGR